MSCLTDALFTSAMVPRPRFAKVHCFPGTRFDSRVANVVRKGRGCFGLGDIFSLETNQNIFSKKSSKNIFAFKQKKIKSILQFRDEIFQSHSGLCYKGGTIVNYDANFYATNCVVTIYSSTVVKYDSSLVAAL